MGTPYQTLYDGVMAKVKEFDLYGLSEDEVNEILSDYIRPAIVRYQGAPSGTFDRDDNAKAFLNELTDVQITILIYFMTIEYIDSNYLISAEIMRQTLPNKDMHGFSPGSHLEKLTAVRGILLRDAEQLMIDYSFAGSGIFNPSREPV